jgi:hypothetical protein
VYEVLKALGGPCEGSWGFVITKSHRGTLGGEPARFLDSVVISEVSPVISAASLGTDRREVHHVTALSPTERAVIQQLEALSERVDQVLRDAASRPLTDDERAFLVAYRAALS